MRTQQTHTQPRHRIKTLFIRLPDLAETQPYKQQPPTRIVSPHVSRQRFPSTTPHNARQIQGRRAPSRLHLSQLEKSVCSARRFRKRRCRKVVCGSDPQYSNRGRQRQRQERKENHPRIYSSRVVNTNQGFVYPVQSSE